MLPAPARLRRREDFTLAVRRGRRAGRDTLVAHYLAPDGAVPVARAGFVVGRAVGNSVVRHRVSRQLRHGTGHHGNGIQNRITWSVIKYVVGYRRAMRPRVMAKIEQFAAGQADVVLLSNRRMMRRWLRKAAEQSSTALFPHRGST